ncbi:MAG: Hsp33 family molecular chaperone [Pseudomonadota bacterium]
MPAEDPVKRVWERAVDIDSIEPAGEDAVVPFAIEALDTRGRAIQMGPALNRILSRHDYPPPVARLLGEMIVLTVLLGTSLKFEGQFIVQTQTDGPVSLLVVDFRTPAAIRAYARFEKEALDAAIEAGETLPEQLLGNGILAMTIDQGVYMNRYQGMVPLEGKTLEEVAHAYFLQSEQIPTRIRLGVAELVSPNGNGGSASSWRAGGVIVQFLPESEDRIRHRDLHGGDGAEDIEHDEDNAWIEAQALLATVEDHELTDPDIRVERLLFRLFHEQGIRLFDPQPVEDKCSCSGEKIWSVLNSMTDDQLEEVVKDGRIEVKCEFCGKDYSISPDDLKRR